MSLMFGGENLSSDINSQELQRPSQSIHEGKRKIDERQKEFMSATGLLAGEKGTEDGKRIAKKDEGKGSFARS